MRKLVLAAASILGIVVCSAGSAVAQPEPAPVPAPAPPPEAAPPALVIAPPSSFGPPSQLDRPVVARPQPESPPGRRFDENTALGLSLGGTLGSWSLLLVGGAAESGPMMRLGALSVVLGPSMGHWYQGTIFTRGMGLRVVGGVIGIYGFFRAAFCEDSCGGPEEYYFYGGALLFVGATIDDIVTAPRRARRHNQRLEGMVVTPMVTDRSAGLALGGRF